MTICTGVLYLTALKTIRAFDLSSNIITLVNSNNIGVGPQYYDFGTRAGFCILPDKVLVCDTVWHVIRAIDKTTGALTE